MDIAPHEQEAIDYAGNMAGEYLESIGVFSLDKLTPEQWATFAQVMCINFSQKEKELASDCPF